MVDDLQDKVACIKQLSPTTKIFVMPVLPTRSNEMNESIVYYNYLVDSMLDSRFGPDIWFPNVENFLDMNMLLSLPLTRNGDSIHLGPKGIAIYVSCMKRVIYQREVCEKRSSSRRQPQARRADPKGPG